MGKLEDIFLTNSRNYGDVTSGKGHKISIKFTLVLNIKFSLCSCGIKT